ncbi:MAG: hypothetical protein HKO07_00320 [Pseudomonadales bacterium]|nr:hypothetical protein [Pseudomonadales bacterium]
MSDKNNKKKTMTSKVWSFLRAMYFFFNTATSNLANALPSYITRPTPTHPETCRRQVIAVVSALLATQMPDRQLNNNENMKKSQHYRAHRFPSCTACHLEMASN